MEKITCTCMLCGLQSKVITYSHLRKAHGITSKEYKERFPNAKMMVRDQQAKERYSKSRKGKPINLPKETREKLADRNRVMNKEKEHIDKVRAAMKGRPKSAEHKEALRAAHAKQDKATITAIYLKNLYGDLDPNELTKRAVYCGVYGLREDINLVVRSKMEANVARVLKCLNMDFEYEPHTFSVLVEGAAHAYTPDFKVGPAYIEVKGYWTADSLKKFNCFKEQYPNVHIEVVDKKVYRKLATRFKHKIPNWE